MYNREMLKEADNLEGNVQNLKPKVITLIFKEFSFKNMLSHLVTSLL